MGDPEEQRDWVDVANELLGKCHIEQKLTKLTDCDANVFASLYENILREKVPDYIASPRSQEDDIHNVQCVIDSLSLDYLQISLSHITGENVIQGDKESIKNLLDIFEGLLEYLSEDICEDSQNDGSQNGGLPKNAGGEAELPTTRNAIQQMDKKMEGEHLSSEGGESTMQSSKMSQHSGNSEQSGSPIEVIGLTVSASTFADQQEEAAVQTLTTDAVVTMDPITTSGPSDDQDAPLAVPQHTAIALNPPTQSNSPHHTDTYAVIPDANIAGSLEGKHNAAAIQAHTSRVVCNGLHSPTMSEKGSSSHRRADIEVETVEPTKGGPKRVLFHTQPDVLLLTLQDEMLVTTPSPPDTEEEEQEEHQCPTKSPLAGRLQNETGLRTWTDEDVEEEKDFETRSRHRKRNRRAEKELHHISEKLTHRIDELDQMLKRLLANNDELGEVKDKEEEFDVSDNIVACNGLPTGTLQTKSNHRACSSFISPLPGHRSVQQHFEDHKDITLNICKDGHQTVVNHAYEAELIRLEGKKRSDLNKDRQKAQEAERKYREAILQDFSKPPRMIPSTKYPSKVHNTSGRLRIAKKMPPLEVKENELLPILLEELPFLHISSHELGRMWRQQKQQVERIRVQASAQKQRRSRSSQELEEAQRKHDLLVGMVHKQQEHSRRLRDFKEQTQQQKSTQSRLREQRQQIARARKYHQDYHVQHRARLMKARINEEKMFRQLFEEGLEVQKARLREQRAFAAEQRLEHQKRHQDHIESMENYYKDQFSLLAEKLAQERQELQIRKKAQEKLLLKMKRDLRSKMEHEIGELQKIIIQNDEDDHFQDLEVQRLCNRVRMASFHCRNNYLH